MSAVTRVAEHREICGGPLPEALVRAVMDFQIVRVGDVERAGVAGAMKRRGASATPLRRTQVTVVRHRAQSGEAFVAQLVGSSRLGRFRPRSGKSPSAPP